MDRSCKVCGALEDGQVLYELSVCKACAKDIAARLKASQAHHHGNSQGFDEFWLAYPRKTAKATALKSWARLIKTEQVKAMEALPVHKKQPGWIKDPTYIPHASTWLNQKRWEDELESDPKWWKAAR